MLNQTAEYALRVVVHLASLPPGERGQAADLAATLGLPANYLSKILHQLGAAGVLESRRGRTGGFRLARPASRTTLAAVVRPFDAVASSRACVLGGSVCSDRVACEAHERWKPVGDSVRRFLRQTTIEDLVRPEHAAPAASRPRTRR